MRLSALSLTSTQQTEFEQLAREAGIAAGYRWLDTSQIPTAVPLALRRKLASALLMWERTSSGATFVVCNGIRLDGRAQALDQEPFGVAIYSSGASTGGIFVHHGSWRSRTTPITPEVQHVLSSSSLANYFPLGEVPSKSSGPLTDLRQTSHEHAFRTTITSLWNRST